VLRHSAFVIVSSFWFRHSHFCGMPKIGLFIPCYIDQLYPRVGMATVELLEHFGVEVDFPEAQTCCGQPMANAGCTEAARPLARRFVQIFSRYEHVVAPSGSCVAMVRQHYEEYFPAGEPLRADYERLRAQTYELTEYLVDVLGTASIKGAFPHRVGIHQSCHGLRELRLGSSSEHVGPSFNKARQLLALLDGIELIELSRPDECCGFGGTFAVAEEAVSSMMGRDRIHDHVQAGAEIITAGDMSCLMHLEGLIRRDKQPLRVMHLAEVLVEAIHVREQLPVGNALRGIPEAPNDIAKPNRPTERHRGRSLHRSD
jgi:L-lactate dehydrogenase complex protein LldE